MLAAAFSPDGRHIATTSADATARLWEAPDGRPPGRNRLSLSQASLSPDGRRLVGISGDRVVLQDAATGKEIRPLRRVERVIDDHGGRMVDVPSAMSFSPDGRRVLIVSRLREVAWIHDVATGKELAALRSRTPAEFGFRDAAFSPDGRRVAAASVIGKGYLFDVATGKEPIVLEGGSPVVSASFRADGRRVLTTPRLVPRPGGFTVKGEPLKSTAPNVRDAATGTVLVTLSPSQPGIGDECTGAAFSPDGHRVVATYSDNAIRIWDADTGKESVLIRGHTQTVNGAVFSPDGRRVLSASNDRTARIWDAATGKEEVVLRGHESGIGAGVQEMTLAVYSPDGKHVVTGEMHGTARLWDAATGEQLAVWKGPRDFVLSAAFSRDGRRVLIGDHNTESWLWPTDPLASALGRKPRDLTAEEQQRYRVALEE